jgi:hypothetical protein
MRLERTGPPFGLHGIQIPDFSHRVSPAFQDAFRQLFL